MAALPMSETHLLWATLNGVIPEDGHLRPQRGSNLTPRQSVTVLNFGGRYRADCFPNITLYFLSVCTSIYLNLLVLV